MCRSYFTIASLIVWSSIGCLIAADRVLHCGLTDEQFLPGWKPCIVKGSSVVTHVDWITSEQPLAIAAVSAKVYQLCYGRLTHSFVQYWIPHRR